MKLLSSLAVAVLLFLGWLSLRAQQTSAPATANSPASQADNPQYKFTARSTLVFLPTRVQDKKGHTIYGLTPEQFVVEDNGVRQSVRIEEDPESLGLSLVVAIQCSRSADKEFNKFKGLSAMVDSITGDAPHEVAVISYGEAIYKLTDFSGSPDAVRFGLSRLKECGDYKAVTIDAVGYAIGMLKQRQNRFRRGILLISEDRDHGSVSKLHDVVAELGITDTIIYSVAFSPTKDEFIRTFRLGSPDAKPDEKPFPSNHPAPAEDSSSASSAPAEPEPVYLPHPPKMVWPSEFTMLMNSLRHSTAPQLASLSGGEYIKFTTQKGFEDGLQRISNQIHDYYLLSFKPPSDTTFSLHTLRVRVPDYPDAVIQTRRSYWSGMLESPATPVSETK